MFVGAEKVDGSEILEFHLICRVCLKEKYLQSIFRYKGEIIPLEEQDLSEKMKICSGLEINPDDGFPANICESCAQLLFSALKFRTLCLQSHRRLTDLLRTKAQQKSILSRNVGLKLDGTFELKLEQASGEKTNAESEVSDLTCGENVNCDEFDGEGCKSFDKLSANGDCEKDLNSFEENGEQDGETSDFDQEDRPILAGFAQDHSFYGCLLCDKQFGDKLSLDMHMAAVHSDGSNQKLFKCYGCRETFQTKCDRVEHEQNACSKMPPGSVYKCRVCSEVYAARIPFDRHLRVHRRAEPPGAPRTLELAPLLRCPRCPKLLATAGSLQKHLALHTGKKNYVCEVCGKRFPRRDYLSIHAAIHAPRECHPCDKCSYSATSRSSLTMHARTHSGERPYVCDACGYRAVNVSNLNRHLRSHNKVKDYKCEECGKLYGYKSLLRDHVTSVHEKLRPHKCAACGETYTRRNGLLRHVYKKHPKV